MNKTPNIWHARETAIVHSIMSGHNSCGTLEALARQGGDALERFLRQCVRATLAVVAAESQQLTREKHALSADNEKKRFALESVVSNLDVSGRPELLAALRAALPAHPLLEGVQ